MTASNRAGLTLIELVVGIVVTSGLLVAAYGGLSTALDRQEVALRSVESDLESAAVRFSLRMWLDGIQVASERSGPTFSGADGEHEGEPDDRLTFLTSAPTPLGYGLTTVQVFVDRDAETIEEGLVATFSSWSSEETTRIQLSRHVTGLDVRYRSRLLAGRTWLPSWISSTVLPAGVELTLVGGAEVPALLRLPLRLRLAGGR